MEIHSFRTLNLSKEVEKALRDAGVSIPTSVQQKALPPMMDGYNVIARAPTGTGKTFAFGIPILEYLNMNVDYIQALILSPTRELALQISSEIKNLGKYIHGLSVVSVIGGQRMDVQIRKLKAHPQIVVATPGRLLDHISRNTISISSIHTLILDEADEMLNMGFIKDIRKIMSYTPSDKQIALFSATMSREVMNISYEYIHRPVEIDIAPKEEDLPKIRQFIITVAEKDKPRITADIITKRSLSKVMIFCNTKSKVRTLTARLRSYGLPVDCLHGDIVQKSRNRIMEEFRNGVFSVLIATDVAARGIDVADIEAVINYDVPLENEYYLHRIGRTGRAGKEGEAFTFVSYAETARMNDIVRFTHAEPEELDPENPGIQE
ncbi:MAG: DEAD/DEAH box helicase [Clostridiaceae bacterium]|nr:DEAD/DEAH box helicase [Clostridiaceae bacterium]